MLDEKHVLAHRQRALSSDTPVLRGSAQNPDVFFQARETCTPFYLACPTIVQDVMDRFTAQTGRAYHLFDYVGAPDADRVLVLMGSGAGPTEEVIDHLNAQGEKIGLLKVRLYRPFATEAFLAALPKTVKSIAVLDRCKEPTGLGEPLYQDVLTAFSEAISSGTSPIATQPRIIGGRYGLSSKDFTPAMVKGVFDELKKEHLKNRFTIGINDDVSHSSLDYDPDFSTEDPKTVRALFYGLGADGTVGANKNSIKIIGAETPNYAQGYFVYDSRKSGSVTTSHLRFGPNPIRSTYLISKANFVACHQFSFLERMDILAAAAPGAVFLLNSPYGPDEIWDHLPKTTQETILKKKLQFYVIDGYTVARETGMGNRLNTIMQTCFFAISGVLPADEAIAQIKKSIKKTYGKRGDAVVQQNFAAVDAAVANLHKVKVPEKATATFDLLPMLPREAPDFVYNVLGTMAAGKGDSLPVSALPIGGTFPTGTAKWEKRNIAQMIPVWDKDLCIQCGKCVLVCPHAVIRAKVYDPALLAGAPETFKSAKPKWKGMEQEAYTLQVAPEDCTGCGLCVEVCPAKSKSEAKHKAINMEMQAPLRAPEAKNWSFFESIPWTDRDRLSHTQVKDIQLLEPLFEFSGACSGCGETPYIKLLTQLFGDRVYIANATGCSSIYGGNLPTTPYTKNASGRGPTWSNSLFEDNAEFGFGMRLALDQQKEYAEDLLKRLAPIGRRRAGDRAADRKPGQGERDRGAARTRAGAPLEAGRCRLRRGPRPAHRGRLAGPQERLDPGRRRLGLRHRLRRSRPRPRLGQEHQGPGARHRDLLQHRRTDVQGNPARRCGQVCRRRQAQQQEGHRNGGRGLRLGLRGARRHGQQRHADGQGLPGGRGLQRPRAHPRLQPLHRPWLRPHLRHGAAEERGALRLLAADALQPDAARRGQEPLPARLPRALHPAEGVRLPRGPLHHADAQPA